MDRCHPLRVVRVGLVFLAALAPGALSTASASAATIGVTTPTDELNADGDCSLREAVAAADLDAVVDNCPAGSGRDTVRVPNGTYVLRGEQVTIQSSLAIAGSGRAGTVVDGNNASIVFGISPGSGYQVTFSGITVRNGNASTGGGNGGGIWAGGPNTRLTLDNVTLDRNVAQFQGGLAPGDVTVIRNSTLSNNSATMDGGAILANVSSLTVQSSVLRNNHAGLSGGALSVSSGSVALTNVTVGGNTAAQNGGGIYVGSGATASLTSSTIAGNQAAVGGGIANAGALAPVLRNSLIARNFNPGNPGGRRDCSGAFTSQGYNLVQTTTGCTIAGDLTGNILHVEPLLGPLQYNGGPTLTRALLTGSPAIDAGNPALPGSGASACPGTDQRGVTRPRDGNGDGVTRCDIGAYEAEAPDVGG